jgi:hypothetical protein
MVTGQKSSPHNLPLPLTSFIGREREIGLIREYVSSR